MEFLKFIEKEQQEQAQIEQNIELQDAEFIKQILEQEQKEIQQQNEENIQKNEEYIQGLLRQSSLEQKQLSGMDDETKKLIEKLQQEEEQDFKKKKQKEEQLSKKLLKDLQNEDEEIQQERNNRKLKRMASSDFDDNLLHCQICKRDLIQQPEEEVWPMKSCQDCFHKKCLQEYLKKQLDEKKLPILCPSKKCQTEVDRFDIEDNVSSDYYSNKYLVSDISQRLTPAQIKCIIQLKQQAKTKSESGYKNYETRMKKLKFDDYDIQNLLFYIREMAPIVIQVRLETLIKIFIKDTHYRSLFEVLTKNGSNLKGQLTGRKNWEKRMFGTVYNNISDFERPKYGTLNFTNDKNGVFCAHGYGSSHFILKPEIRSRCTITDKDSASNCLIGTIDHCIHILNTFSDQELINCVEGARGGTASSKVIPMYKEIQIHGPVDFSKDIECVMVQQSIMSNAAFKKDFQQFIDKNKLKYQCI